jgi:hypothetical protein
MSHLVGGVKRASVADHLEIPRCEIHNRFQFIKEWRRKDRVDKRREEFLIKKDVALRLQIIETDFEIEAADGGLVQIHEAVGSADEDAPEPLHLCEKLVGEADFPCVMSPVPASQNRVHLVHHKNRLLRLSLVKGKGEILFRHPHIGIEKIARSLADQFPVEGAGDVARKLALACARRTVEKDVGRSARLFSKERQDVIGPLPVEYVAFQRMLLAFTGVKKFLDTKPEAGF